MSNISAFEKYPFEVASLPTEEGGGFVVTFPDLPGCVADGATEKEAIAQARSAFHVWMESMIGDDRPIPLPGSAGRAGSPPLPEPRQFSREQMQTWIAEDEEGMRRFQADETQRRRT
jgi:predicted RNase H-like HicB family nuclease